MKIEKVDLRPGIYIVSTPIGNLEDITIRALKVLNSVDIIACEDTMHSNKLLSAYGISASLLCYNDYSDEKVRQKIIDKVKHGMSIALISDAGTPLISDPGYKLIRYAYENGVYVTSCPGACSAISALTNSGSPTNTFIFEGFLPVATNARADRLKVLEKSESTVIIFESSKKLLGTLEDIQKAYGDIVISLHRELTKKFEENIFDSISSIISHHKNAHYKGELVIVIPPKITNKNDIDEAKIIEEIQLLTNPQTTKDTVAVLKNKYPNLAKTDLYKLVQNNR